MFEVEALIFGNIWNKSMTKKKINIHPPNILKIGAMLFNFFRNLDTPSKI